MALPSTTFESIVNSIKNKDLAPVYLLHGEEGYFTDVLAGMFEDILTEDEKTFNQYIVYAPQTEPAQIIDLCRRIPMMAERQVVIVKEAQAIRADKLAKLAPYLAAPTPTTLLVICCRAAQAKGKELMDAIAKGRGVVFESKKIADYNIPTYLNQYIRTKGLSADQKALEMLRDFIGSDLSKLYNEIDKLAGLLPPKAAITPEVIELNIGISKEYNSFELVDAIAVRDAVKAFRCLAYFQNNPKAVPSVMITAALFNFFADLLIAYYTPKRADAEITEALKLRNSFALKRIRQGMASYNPFQIIEIISAIRTFDTRSKGVGSRQNEHRLLHELVYHILSAPGRI